MTTKMYDTESMWVVEHKCEHWEIRGKFFAHHKAMDFARELDHQWLSDESQLLEYPVNDVPH